MALSLPGERSGTAATPTTPLRALLAWIVKVNADRQRRTVLRSLLALDPERLRDLGLSHADIHDAMTARNARAAVMVLNGARARQALI